MDKCLISLQLLVYGAGQVIPSTLKILDPNLKFSLFVNLSSSVDYGRVILVMDKNFCTDSAGNKFTRTVNSSFLVHFGESDIRFGNIVVLSVSSGTCIYHVILLV